MSTTDDITVTENAQSNRFEAHLDGNLVGVIDYIPLPGKIIATHTEVLGDNKGRGVGARLVREMIGALRADGRRVQPLCPYVAQYLRRHPDEADVVDPETPH